MTIALKYKTETKIADFFVGFLYFLIYTGLFLSPHSDWIDELILFVVNILAQISFISKLYAVICLPWKVASLTSNDIPKGLPFI